jgi:hypothetical protein
MPKLKLANTLSVPRRSRQQADKATAAFRNSLWAVATAIVCLAAGMVAWMLFNSNDAPVITEPQAAEVTTTANESPVPIEPKGRSEQDTATTRPTPAFVSKEKEPATASVAPTEVEKPQPATLPPPPTAKDTKPPLSAFTYWMARKPDTALNEFVFDIRVPADLAAMIACTQPPYLPYQASIQKIDWFSKGTKYVLLNNRLSWKGDDIENGRIGLAFLGGRNSPTFSTSDPDWTACKQQLLAQAVAAADLKTAAVTIVKVDGPAKPDLRVKLGGGPSAAFSMKPHIVAVTQKKQLYVSWQTTGNGPTPKIAIHKIDTYALELGNLTLVRDVDSLGTLVGFTVDEGGADYVLTAKTEDFGLNPAGDFVNGIHKSWRKNVLVLYRNGKANDLNSERFTDLPFYGLTNFGTGRLAVSPTHIAAIFSRRRYTPGDNLIHQQASDLVISRDMAQVPIKAGNVVSHSFSQRLIADGGDFVTLHAGDSYPYPGLIIEKMSKRTGMARFNAYSCPTSGNSLFFELGGIAAEADGYPILFTASRNTATVNNANIGQLRGMPPELAMVYVVRNFETKPGAKNPYDTISSGILAAGYAPDQDFVAEVAAWNAASSRFDKMESHNFRRRVLWLTEHDKPGGASNAKLVKLADGKYIALWTEAGRGTCAMLLTISGRGTAKSIAKGDLVELKGVPLPLGDDALALRINGVPHAAWITSGGQILLHTLDANLAYRVYPLNLP